jgi:hypothetical protein
MNQDQAGKAESLLSHSRPFAFPWASPPLPKLCIPEIPAYNGFMRSFHFAPIASSSARAAAAVSATDSYWIHITNPMIFAGEWSENSKPVLIDAFFFKGTA